MRTLLIDDEREIPATVTARDYEAAVRALVADGPVWDKIYLDHDLGDSACNKNVNGRPLTGYDICEIMRLLPAVRLPHVVQLVTANPVGRKNMQDVLRGLYARESVDGLTFSEPYVQLAKNLS